MKYDKVHIIVTLLFLMGFVLSTGCNKGGLPGLVRCEGTVSWKGEPVEEAFVAFSPKDNSDGRSASGTTDAQGRFKVSTLNNNDGILPGEYFVTISKSTTTREGGLESSDNPDENRGRIVQETVTETHFIPQAYADRKTSGLSAVISSKGEKNLTFELVGEIQPSGRPVR